MTTPKTKRELVLFIDTNVLLSFYHLTNEDLEELRKLHALLQHKKVTLIVPQQVVEEFRRNRETKIADALRRYDEQRLGNVFPQFCREYPEYNELRSCITKYDETKARLRNSIVKDISAQSLKADLVIDGLFSNATIVDRTNDIVVRARLRYDLGNPPGKRDSLGDAINWESILVAVEIGEDLFLVSEDGDYASKLDEDALSPFLKEEWVKSKSSAIHYYRRISAFLREKFPAIHLAAEVDKELLIAELAKSPTFARSRHIVSALSKFAEFTKPQLVEIFRAIAENNQVYWILSDDDIWAYVNAFFSQGAKQLDAALVERVRVRLEYARAERQSRAIGPAMDCPDDS